MTKEHVQNIKRSPSAEVWKDQLTDQVPLDWIEGINNFETEVFLKKQGKVEEKVFAETRLRRGAYGQRYDNGVRHNGREQVAIPFPNKGVTKGPNTEWDAPGMVRIKIPYGGVNVKQMEVLADLAEEYSDSICHVTTRQDIQLHFVHIEDTPSVFRRLAAVRITTQEACGNSVRNVTACPLAGVCADAAFDVTPYAEIMFRYFLGHPDIQDFGRKFKIAFSGCTDKPCGLAKLHDLGLIAKKKTVDGKEKLGFEYYVGGGLGAVPYQAKLFDEFVPVEEMLPLTQAVFRIFARHGEKKNRNRARIKFLVSDWGIEKFREEVFKERKALKTDPRWAEFISRVESFKEIPLKEKAEDALPQKSTADVEYDQWLANNVKSQKQKGYSVVTIALPLGDITANQLRGLADICQKYIQDTVRLTVTQNIVLRWVAHSDLSSLCQELKKIDLADPIFNTIIDMTACPGTDTCKLGISSSRGLAGYLRKYLTQKGYHKDPVVKKLKIKMSGCFNSCGQHHVADIGFYGISRKVAGRIVPHFQLVLGGQWDHNAGSYGMAVVGIPSKAIPQVVDRLVNMYVKERQVTESFQEFVKRLGKVKIKQSLLDLTAVPEYHKDPSYYIDWGDVREFTTSDIGVGECAGEVVSLVEFGLTKADREVFESQVALEEGDCKKAARLAYQSMVTAAQGLIKGQNPDISDDPDVIIAEFDKLFCQTQLFHHPFMGDKFAKYIFEAQKKGVEGLSDEVVHHRVEEAQLFVEAAYSCHVRMSMS